MCLCRKKILWKLSPYSIVDDLCFRNFCLEKSTNSFYGPRMNISVRHMPSLFLEFKTELFTQKEKGCLDTAIPLKICWLFPPCSLKVLCTLWRRKDIDISPSHQPHKLQYQPAKHVTKCSLSGSETCSSKGNSTINPVKIPLTEEVLILQL